MTSYRVSGFFGGAFSYGLPDYVSDLDLDSGYAFAITDDEDSIMLGVQTNGDLVARIPQLDGVNDSIDAVNASIVGLGNLPDYVSDLDDSTNYAFAVTDDDDNIMLGVKSNGDLVARIPQLDGSDASLGALTPPTSIVCWGDSLTAGGGSSGGSAPGTTFPSRLATLLSRDVSNQGASGQTSTEIAARAGAVDFLLTVTSNQIPTSGPVDVTARSVDAIDAGSAQSYTGTLAGVPGTLARDVSDNYTFTRTTAGTVVACPAGTPFLFDLAEQLRDRIAILWLGHNNWAEFDEVREQNLAIVDRLTGIHKRVLVLGLVWGDSEPAGSAGALGKGAIDTEMGRLFGDCFIDIRTYLLERGLDEAGITATTTDDDNIADGITPDSIRNDTLHLNSDGYIVVAEHVARIIRAKGW